MTLDSKTFDFVSALTGVFALVYLGGSVYALVTRCATSPAVQGGEG